MNKRIIYPKDDGGVAVIVPAQEALEQYGIEAIALKDVPTGKPFAIIDALEVPADRTFRDAWVVDPSLLVDGVGGASSEFNGVSND